MASTAPAVPQHVPYELVVDFDFYRPEGADVDPFLALKKLHEKPEIFWTPVFVPSARPVLLYSTRGF